MEEMKKKILEIKKDRKKNDYDINNGVAQV